MNTKTKYQKTKFTRKSLNMFVSRQTKKFAEHNCVCSLSITLIFSAKCALLSWICPPEFDFVFSIFAVLIKTPSTCCLTGHRAVFEVFCYFGLWSVLCTSNDCHFFVFIFIYINWILALKELTKTRGVIFLI